MGTPVLEGVNACPVMRGRNRGTSCAGEPAARTPRIRFFRRRDRRDFDRWFVASCRRRSVGVPVGHRPVDRRLRTRLCGRRAPSDRANTSLETGPRAPGGPHTLRRSQSRDCAGSVPRITPCGARARRGLRRRVYADGSGTRCSGVGPAARPRIGLRRQWRVGGGNRRCAVGNDPRRLPRLAFSVLSRSGDDLGAHCRAGERRQPQRRVVATRLFGLSAAPTSPDDADGDAALGRRQFHVLHVLRRRFSPRSASTAAASRSRKLSASADAN